MCVNQAELQNLLSFLERIAVFATSCGNTPGTMFQRYRKDGGQTRVAAPLERPGLRQPEVREPAVELEAPNLRSLVAEGQPDFSTMPLSTMRSRLFLDIVRSSSQ